MEGLWRVYFQPSTPFFVRLSIKWGYNPIYLIYIIYIIYIIYYMEGMEGMEGYLETIFKKI